jgi:hypothetical protein
LEKQQLQLVDQQQQVTTDYVPSIIMTPDMATELINQLDQLKKNVLRNKVDYDTIPGTPKPSLLKPGAERLLMCFGLGHRVHEVRQIEDWENGFFHYVYKITIHKSYPTHEIVIAECIGSANSMEKRYKDRWVFDSEAREMGLDIGDLEKKQRTSKAGKPFFVYKVVNPDPYSLVNTLQKMAIKRALVGATLQATGTSEFFTQDIEDTGVQQQEPQKETKTVTEIKKKQQTTQKPPQKKQEPKIEPKKAEPSKTQPTEAERKAKGVQMMYTEASNKKLSKEESKVIIEHETNKTSANDLALEQLRNMYNLFKTTSAGDLKEIATAYLMAKEAKKENLIYDVDPETGEVIQGGAA